MGRGKAERPKRIGQKLKSVRLSLGLTQDGMTKALEKQGVKMHQSYVALYEISDRVPSLVITLAYAKLAGISMDYLVDDELDLP